MKKQDNEICITNLGLHIHGMTRFMYDFLLKFPLIKISKEKIKQIS